MTTLDHDADSNGNIHLTSPNPGWNEAQLLEWKMMAYHEISHQLPKMRDAFALLKRLNLKTGEVNDIIPQLVDLDVFDPVSRM